MKNTLLVLFTLLSFGLSAQVSFEDDINYMVYNLNGASKYQKHLANEHITSVKVYACSHKHSDSIIRQEYKYDIHGNMLEETEYKKHGQLKSGFKYQYNDSNWTISLVALNRKGKQKWGSRWTYDQFGRAIQNQNWWKDTGNVTYKCVITYDSKHKPVESKIYYSKKLYYTTTYEYHEDGSKKKTTNYNRRGKVIGVWNYDCDPIGKLQESKMKDTSKICVHYETDKNGNPVKIKEESTEAGWLFKYRLRKISKYDKDNNLIELVRMKMNGKETWHSSADINAQGYQTEWRQYIPNSSIIKKRWVCTYNSAGDVIETLVFLKPSDKGTVLKYVYN